jgi:hypothetical protein
MSPFYDFYDLKRPTQDVESYGDGARATGARAGEEGIDEDDEDAESEENLRERLWSAGPSGPPDIAGVNAGSSGDFARLYEEDNIASPDLATLDGDIENINGRAQGP